LGVPEGQGKPLQTPVEMPKPEEGYPFTVTCIGGLRVVISVVTQGGKYLKLLRIGPA
jgi:hypothetical protein